MSRPQWTPRGRKGSRGVPAKPGALPPESPEENKARCSHIPPETKFGVEEDIEIVLILLSHLTPPQNQCISIG